MGPKRVRVPVALLNKNAPSGVGNAALVDDSARFPQSSKYHSGFRTCLRASEP